MAHVRGVLLYWWRGSVADDVAHRGLDARWPGQEGLLQGLRVRDRRVGGGHPPYRRGQVTVQFLMKRGGEFRPETASPYRLVHDDGPLRTCDRGQYGLRVERVQGPQVDHFGVDAVGRQLLGHC